MKRLISILFLAAGVFCLNSCSKPSESAKGYYSGTFTFNGTAGGTATTDIVVVDATRFKPFFLLTEAPIPL